MVIWEDRHFINRLKKNRISLSQEGTTLVSYGKEEVQMILAHRNPFLFMDSITKVNLVEQAIETGRSIDAEDPVFEGHFPGEPVYPGVLQIEMMGQAGLCLAHFVKTNTTHIHSDTQPIKGMFTQVHYAAFIQPILPEDTLVVVAQMIDHDDFLGQVSGQIIRNNEVCSCSVLEVYFDE